MPKQPKRPVALRESPFFRDIPNACLSRVEGLVYHRDYEPRQIIFFPDDSCDFVYWVREGQVRLTRVSGDGRELTFRHLFPGDILGEDLIINRPRRENYAEALHATTLCLMRAPDFRRLMREEADFALTVARHLSHRVIEVEQVLVETIFLPVRARVAAGLVRLHERQPPNPENAVRVTHQELANLVGTTRETTTATLHTMRNDGLLTIANRRIHLLDIPRLREVATGAA